MVRKQLSQNLTAVESSITLTTHIYDLVPDYSKLSK